MGELGSTNWHDNRMGGSKPGTKERLNEEDSFYVLLPDGDASPETVSDYQFGEDELLAICTPELYGPGKHGTARHGVYRSTWNDDSKQNGNITILVDHPENFFDFEEDYEWLEREDFNREYNPWIDVNIGVVGDVEPNKIYGSEIVVTERESEDPLATVNEALSNYDGGSVLED